MGKLGLKISAGLPRQAPPRLLGLPTFKKFLGHVLSPFNLITDGGHRMDFDREGGDLLNVFAQVISLVLPTTARIALPSIYFH